MQKIIQGAKDLGSDALDFIVPSANAAEPSGNSGPASGFRGPDLTQQQNTPIPGAPVESIVPSISVDGPPAIERIIASQGNMVPGQQGQDGYYSPTYRPPVSDWTGEGRGRFNPAKPDWTGEGRGLFDPDPAQMSDRQMSIEEEAMQTASDLLQMGAKSMSDVGKKAAVEAATGEGPGFLSAIKNFIGDEEKMLTLAQAFNTMRTNRDDQLGSFIGKRLETLRGAKGANATIEYLIRQGRPELAEAVRGGTITAKEALDMVKGTSAMQEYKYAQQYQGYTGTLEDWMKLKQQQINLGGQNKYQEELAKMQVKQIEEYRTAGNNARSVMDQLMNFQANAAGIETGPYEQRVQALRQFAASIGLPADKVKLTEGQSIAAASNALVAEQLRLNKGPQTDFDAEFTKSFVPSLGNTPEANQRIINYLLSVNRLKGIYADLADSVITGDPARDRKALSKINKYNSNVAAVAKNDAGEWITFEKFHENLSGKYDDETILNEWIKRAKRR
jgi:hypothetical protein